jgi:hypothetical protein
VIPIVPDPVIVPPVSGPLVPTLVTVPTFQVLFALMSNVTPLIVSVVVLDAPSVIPYPANVVGVLVILLHASEAIQDGLVYDWSVRTSPTV